MQKAVVLLVGSIAFAGTTIYVDDVTDPLEDGTIEHPFDTIQEAIDAAADGDTVAVKDGTYSGVGNRDISFLGRAITVMSQNGPEGCVIDCESTYEEPHLGFHFHSGEDASTTLDGFTIKRAANFESSGDGAGILCEESSPTITNNTITDNGNGIRCFGSSP